LFRFDDAAIDMQIEQGPASPPSPLTGRRGEKVGVLPVTALKAAYLREHGFDVGPFLPALDELAIYRCPDTALEYFGPGKLAGSPAFYEALYADAGAPAGYDSQIMYRQKKWEFDIAAGILGAAPEVLDVGCGAGDFLASLNSGARNLVGLETSALGRSAASAKGLDVRDETIEAHAAANAGRYAAVTAFQVVEHVDDPRSFLNASIAALKPRGVLIVSTPNNDSFLKDCPLLPLNSPPHHVTRWGRRTFESVPSYFAIELMRIEKEPLQAANVGWYVSAMEEKFLARSRIARSLYHRSGGRAAFRRFVESQRETIDGHTILAAYRKTP